MKTLKINDHLQVPVIAVGCMRINQLEKPEREGFIMEAVEQGANYFDHADIYGKGTCESLFGEAFQNSGLSRDHVFIQTKCGIRQGYYDLSKEHILHSVEQSLKNLKTDYIDVLLLHRPDALCEPEEVADAFDSLFSSGKVRTFGVSNYNPMQIELLKKHLRQPLVINQLQFGIAHAQMVSNGINVNTRYPSAIDRDGSVLDYCRLNDMTIQPWSPFQYGFIEGVFIGNDKFPELNHTLEKIAADYQVSTTTLAIAWILRHPAQMQPIAGTTNRHRLAEICRAAEINISREAWYEIYRAAGNNIP
ncbi:aldo/keto reductase [Oscillospiraceae bacterium PP1C4]